VKIVVDTNVIMSGIFFGGVPGRLLDAWVAGRVELVLSPAILMEYRRVGAELAVRYPARGEALTPVLALIAMNATLVDAKPLSERISADPDDDKFLAAAVAANVPVVVSKDAVASAAPPQKRRPLARLTGSPYLSCRRVP